MATRPTRALALFHVLIVSCVSAPEDRQPARTVGPDSTYEKFLVRALQGDAASQNLVGFMLYFGDGVPIDQESARVWFELAANQGHPGAQRSLGAIRTSNPRGPAISGDSAPGGGPITQITSTVTQGPTPGDMAASAAFTNDQEQYSLDNALVAGQSGYETFCAGCHGLNGISAYVYSPSFAFGERMDKSDDELLRSISEGLGNMPGWRGILPRDDLADILAYVRAFSRRYQLGIAGGVRPVPEFYYTFGPMRGLDLAAPGWP